MTMSADPPTRKLPLQRRLLFVGAYIVFFGLVVWGAWRVVLRVRAGVGLSDSIRPIDIWKFHYPELGDTNVLTDADSATDFNVLLLGASVMQQLADPLTREVTRDVPDHRRVRVYNLARAAHTSRDSLLKTRRIGHRRFDLVLIYHGINDARMNCCPPDAFRADYLHCGWYAGMDKRIRAGRITLKDLVLDTTARLIPIGEPDAGQRVHGHQIRTAAPFRENLKEIIGLVRRANPKARVGLITFAFHIPKNYERSVFEAGGLGYGQGDYQMPVESWGDAAAVAAAIRAHNGELRRLAESTGSLLIDQAGNPENQPLFFSDPCHLTDRGIRAFVRLVADSL